jgi:hypothetical protein
MSEGGNQMASKTLKTKQGSEWTNDLGETFPAAPLFRFEDENGRGGCWYSTVEKAEASWKLYEAGAARRAARAAETARYRELVAAHDERGKSDPFYGLA